MKAGDLPETAARLKVVSERSSIRAAADAFSDTRFGLVVVCDDAHAATGVVSKSDLVRHLAQAGRIDVPVTTVMTRAVASASPGADLRAAWQCMVARRLQNLPLLGADRRPVGTLDIRDALQAILRIEEDQESQLINYIAGNGYR